MAPPGCAPGPGGSTGNARWAARLAEAAPWLNVRVRKLLHGVFQHAKDAGVGCSAACCAARGDRQLQPVTPGACHAMYDHVACRRLPLLAAWKASSVADTGGSSLPGVSVPECAMHPDGGLCPAPEHHAEAGVAYRGTS